MTYPRRPVGIQLQAARETAGLTQAELADIIGTSDTRISKWERGTDSPGLEYCVRLCRALDISLDSLAGLIPLELDLQGVWYFACQTWRGGAEVIDLEAMQATHHGDQVRIRSLGDYEWVINLRFQWRVLHGGFRATRSTGQTLGQMFLSLTADDSTALGSWAGLTEEGKHGMGYGVLSRDKETASGLIKRMINDPASVTEWPIELAATQGISR